MKKYFTLFIAVAFMFSSCLKDDVDGLQKQIDDLENRTSELETQIKLYSDLQKAHENNLHITNIISQDNGTTLVMNDGSQIFVPNADNMIPYVGDNGNWWIDGKDTGKPSVGENGSDGLTPYIGDNGNWWIGDADTGKPSTGNDGSDGNNGITPHIGENGNWWIGNVDTGLSSKGSDGNDGVTPHIGENGNWWIGTNDTGVLASAPTIISIQYLDGEMVYTFSDGSTLNLIIENEEELENQKNWKAVAIHGGYSLIVYNGTETKVIIPNTIYGEPVIELGINGATSSEYSIIPLRMKLLVTEVDFSQSASLKKINDYAFSGLTKIQEITLPESLLSIEESSFDGCINLKTVTILKETEQYTTCKESSFENTPIKIGAEDTKIIYPVGTPYPTVDAWFANGADFIDSDGNYYGIPNGTIITEGDWTGVKVSGGIQITLYSGSDKNVVFPNKIKDLDVVSTVGTYNNYNIFRDGWRDYYTSIDMSNCESLKEIGRGTFYGSKGIISVMLPEGLEIIGYGAFRQAKFTSIVLPESLVSIGDDAFFDGKFTSINLPEGLTSIGKNAFWFSELTSIVLPESLMSIGERAFYYNRNLTSVTIKNASSILTKSASDSFEYTPIIEGKDGANIYYPSGTNYPNEDGWNRNQATFVAQ